MLGLGWPELIVIFLLVLILFGASRLPEIGSGLGKGIMNFKKAIYDTDKPVQPPAETGAPKDQEKEKKV